jgi:ubiquinone/menaquinone biosynthesis C-methylase UbiE
LAKKPRKSYTKLAKYYDAIYNKMVDYESQASYLEKIFHDFHRGRVRSILDVGCGTGNFTLLFAKRGYRTTGIDLSEDMIRVAKGKRSPSRANPEFFGMDMRDIRLKNKYDAATVLFGGFGYLLKYEDIRKFLASTRRSLNKDGLLIFEFWHTSGLRPESSSKNGYNTFVKARYGDNLIIRLDTNKYDPITDVCHITFDTFILNPKTKRLIDSFSETHLLKTYSISEMRNLLEEGDFNVLGFFEDSLGASGKIVPVRQSTFRVLAVATI